MSRTVRVGALGIFCLVVLTQFTNCSSYTSPVTTATESTSLSCSDKSCVQANSEQLKITPVLGGGQYSVAADLSEFNLGGECNEGGYPYNTIRWELILNGVVVRHSGMAVAAGQSANSTCINGRFSIYVNLASLPGDDPVNRTGLMTGSGTTRAPYTLSIEIMGQSTAGGLPVRTIAGVTRVPLLAP